MLLHLQKKSKMTCNFGNYFSEFLIRVKPNPGLAACHKDSQTHETGAGEKRKEVLFKLLAIQEGRGLKSSEKLILLSLVEPMILIGSWWKLRRRATSQGECGQMCCFSWEYEEGELKAESCSFFTSSLPLFWCYLSTYTSIPPFPRHLWFMAGCQHISSLAAAARRTEIQS